MDPAVAAAAEEAAMALTMDTVLDWIGFDNVANRERLIAEGFTSFDDMKLMEDKDVRDLAESYGRRTVIDGRCIFGMRRARLLTGLIHWVQDHDRIGKVPSLDEFDGDAAAFREALDVAAKRAKFRKVEKDQSDTISKAADPGKFKDEKKWALWEPSFCNYLATIPGITGVPLSYVVRVKETPVEGLEYESFNEQAVACCPLEGTVFQADSRKVHQLLKSFLQAETAEQWIKPLEKKLNGRQDMEALRNHYAGEGNASRRIAMAERIRDSLHYKNERAMPFSGFLDKLQTMFNIFAEEREPITERAKIRMLLSKVEHPQLQSTVDALAIRAQMDGSTFTACANFLASQVSKLPDHQSGRKIAGTGSDRGKDEVKRIRGGGAKGTGDGGKRNGIHMPDGSIWTGYYSDWNEMTKEDRQTVMDTRVKGTNKNKKGSGGSKSKTKAGGKDHKAQVAALKRKLAALTANKSSKCDDEEADDDSSAPDNAGDSFGGRQKKKQKKD